ncbi:MAG: amidohydrolase/deacetylase family metallohydrolase [Candidatus Latescibacteria bacterium]|jgi:dihydroorotase|nr:amidohydrolase/deacetylase family metallohydrolase [Candidatus Latescibacterota bacterium]
MRKMLCISAAFLMLAFVVSPVFAQERTRPAILLKGGHVIDPANNINSKMDILISKGKIARVDKNIPASEVGKVVDVSGYYVTPGFIDMHVHCFHTNKKNNLSIVADGHHFPSGVTTCVDAGTSGASNFEEFKKVIDSSRVRILAFLNIADTGMGDDEHEPDHFDVKLAAETAKKYPDIIVGFKSAHYWRDWFGNHGTTRKYDEIHTPWASVDSTVAAGNLAGLPVMIDYNPFPPQGNWPARSYRGLIIDRLRPGDIHTHCYARHIPVIEKDGTVNKDIMKARKRGVIFDVGFGGASIVYRNAIPAIKQGYIANSISTDLHTGNVNGPVVNMISVMSNFLNMGLSIEDVIRLSTSEPSRIVNHPELGNLSVGSTADITVTELLHGDYSYKDTSGGMIKGDKKLQCMLTVFGGRIVFDPSGLTAPEWKKIPKSDDYWVNPSGQYW